MVVGLLLSMIHMLSLELPQEIQHAYHAHHDPRQCRPDGNQANSLLLELIEPEAQAAKLAFHSVVAVLPSHYDLQGEVRL